MTQVPRTSYRRGTPRCPLVSAGSRGPILPLLLHVKAARSGEGVRALVATSFSSDVLIPGLGFALPRREPRKSPASLYRCHDQISYNGRSAGPIRDVIFRWTGARAWTAVADREDQTASVQVRGGRYYDAAPGSSDEEPQPLAFALSPRAKAHIASGDPGYAPMPPAASTSVIPCAYRGTDAGSEGACSELLTSGGGVPPSHKAVGQSVASRGCTCMGCAGLRMTASGASVLRLAPERP